MECSFASFPTLSALAVARPPVQRHQHQSQRAVPVRPGSDQPHFTLLYGNPLNNTPVNGNVQSVNYDPNANLVQFAPRQDFSRSILPRRTRPASLPRSTPRSPPTPIRPIAAAFYNLPVEIYQYLVNTIKFQPYQGAMKGPLAVLQTGAGNDWDTDSLLVQLFSAAGIGINTIQYASTSSSNGSAILLPIQSAMQYIGVKTPDALYTILWDAGLIPNLWDSSVLTQQHPTPLNPSTQANSAVYASFQHVWLQWTSPQGTVALDPTWKFRDFQAGLPGMLTTLAFDETTYLAQPQQETAAEFYENQVRSYLATNDPSLTIADVPYDGPIHSQQITALSASTPYLYLNTPITYSITSPNQIPTGYEQQLRISVDVPQTGNSVSGVYNNNSSNPQTTLTAANLVFTQAMVGQPVVIQMPSGGSTTPTEFLIVSYNSSTHAVVVIGNATCTSAAFSVPGFPSPQIENVPDIDLKRITISSEGTGSPLTPTLNIEGNTPVASLLSVPNQNPFYVTIDYIPGDSNVTGISGRPYSNIYSRNSGDYLALGVDADQESSETLVRARQIVNQQEIVKTDNTPRTATHSSAVSCNWPRRPITTKAARGRSRFAA